VTTVRRPLPRSLVPHPDESLTGYLLNLSTRLRDAPGRLAVRVGLADPGGTDGTTWLAAPYAVRLPPDRAAELGRVTGMSPDEVTRLTVARWDGLLLTDDATAARTDHGRAWTPPASTSACPACLPRTDGPVGDDGQPRYALWKTAWRTPWAFACTLHGVLLTDRCPGCGTLLGLGRGDRRLGLVPAPGTAGLHPAACRAITPAGRPCGHRLDQATPRPCPVDPAVLDAQRRLDDLLAGTGTRTTTLGADVGPAPWLRDLRLVAVALRLVDPDLWPTPPPAGLRETVGLEHQQRVGRRAASRGTGARDDRVWTEPPVDSAVTATLVTTAMRLLDTDDTAGGRDTIAPLVAAAAAAEPLLWNRIRGTGQPSPRLARWTSPGHGGTFSTHTLTQATTGTALTAGADQVPQWATPEQDTLVAPLAPGTSPRDRRRATSLALVRLLEQTGLHTAADRLGIPHVSAQAAVARTGKALRQAGTDDAYRDLIATLAAALGPDSTDHGLLRHQHGGTQPWHLPDEEWQHLKAEMLYLHLARADTDWDRRRTAVSIWTWARRTGGDPALAPLARAVSGTGRNCTDGALADVSALERHAGLRAVLLDS